ncbi:Hexon-interlacing protein, partial [Dissostichus eleginoides]
RPEKGPAMLRPELPPFRRVTFSVVSQPQDPHQQGSLQSCYDSGLDESETPSSKSSSGPRLGALPLPEDSYERTTPDGSVGEAEHLENGTLSSACFPSFPLDLPLPLLLFLLLALTFLPFVKITGLDSEHDCGEDEKWKENAG